MYKAIVFAGTTEGYEMCRYLSRHGIFVCACVATEYGTRSLREGDYLKILAGRLDCEQMQKLFGEQMPDIVLDATHPYAAVVTENIREACRLFGLEYVRVLRSGSSRQSEAVYVDTVEDAAEYLKGTAGNVLLTTGSKDLRKFTVIPGYQNRLYARVLSLPEVMADCSSYGLEGRHLIGMQGPFTMEMNAAMLRQYDCKYLVTKDSGKAGGFLEKIQAAQQCGAIPVIIGRPLKEEGLDPDAARAFLSKRFHLSADYRITLLGIGMGSRDTLTLEGKKVLEQAQLVIGAKRMVDAVADSHHAIHYEYRSEAIAEYILAHPEYEMVVVALSGDVGFYSGAKKLLAVLPGEVSMVCGISSVAYFMAKAGLSWDDAKIVSAHGRDCNLVGQIRYHEKVFAILGTADGVSSLAKKLCSYGMGATELYVGENLSYEDEKIFVKKAEELVSYEGNPLSVVCAFNREALSFPQTHGLADSMFLRGKAPMTKEEVRCVSLAKLRLTLDSVCYDVGAGTGSVAIEMALRALEGKVYAIEKKEEALELIKENKRKFAADNLEIIGGTAPEALEDLPAPTHGFIGGSSGNLRQIMETLLNKNPRVKMVINCITMETVTEALAAVSALSLESEIVQMNVARSREVGRYHMMMGENPIYIITCEKAH